jgi:hypothetical protein
LSLEEQTDQDNNASFHDKTGNIFIFFGTFLLSSFELSVSGFYTKVDGIVAGFVLFADGEIFVVLLPFPGDISSSHGGCL